MKCPLVVILAVVAQCCFFGAAYEPDDRDPLLLAALEPVCTKLRISQNQLDQIREIFQQCSDPGPLGLEDRRIPDSSIKASSIYHNKATFGPPKGRLSYRGAWMRGSDSKPWIQVDFSNPVTITGVITQGRFDGNNWVTEFTVAYSDDGTDWTDVTAAGANAPAKFPGNSDRNTQVTTSFKHIRARFLRILPLKCYSTCCLRFEVLGCNSQE